MLKLFKTITPDDFFWNDLLKYFDGLKSELIKRNSDIDPAFI